MKNPFSAIFIDDGLNEKQAQKRYQKRRAEFAKKIGHPILLRGLVNHIPRYYHWSIFHIPIFQEPFFLYLTGINQPNVALWLDPKTKSDILFLEQVDVKATQWDGLHFAIGDSQLKEVIKRKTGFTDIRPMKQLYKTVQEHLQQNPSEQLGMIWHEYQSGTEKKYFKDTNWEFKNKIITFLKAQHLNPNRLVNIMQNQWDFRLPLDEIDHKNAQLANQKAIQALIRLIKEMSKFSTETEVCGFLKGQLLMQSPFGLSFEPIIAGGENALTLHYVKNNDLLQKGELLLLDFGVRWQNMHSDISRTIPINGKFNPMQKILYAIVLNAQNFVEKQVKPGITIEELNTKCWQFIETELEEKFLGKGGKAKLTSQKHPHFVSHLMGYQVHDGDPFRLYRTQPLKKGYLISNEPGLYGEFEMSIKGVQYHEKVGIRIEDNLLITEKGCENLTKACPKTIEDIQNLF